MRSGVCVCVCAHVLLRGNADSVFAVASTDMCWEA
jgi:hypothetical protein